jgi:hypothetical protein
METQGLSRSPTRANFQNRPRNLQRTCHSSRDGPASSKMLSQAGLRQEGLICAAVQAREQKCSGCGASPGRCCRAAASPGALAQEGWGCIQRPVAMMLVSKVTQAARSSAQAPPTRVQ